MKLVFSTSLIITLIALLVHTAYTSPHPTPILTPLSSRAPKPSQNNPTRARGNRYQGKEFPVPRPNGQNTPEKNLTRSQMAQLMGAAQSDDASNNSSEDVTHLLQTYWLPNSQRQILRTFRVLQGNGRSIDVRYGRGIPDTFGVNSWARCSYVGHASLGNDNHMQDIVILIDLEDCLDSKAHRQISGIDDGYYCMDQIIAHELMHAYLAETAPGYVLGSTCAEWFTEGVAETANGGVPHMGGRSAAALCANLGAGYVDYGGSYLAVTYAAWLSANKGYGGECTVTAENLAYGLNRILAKLRETGDLDKALQSAIEMTAREFEQHVRSECGSNGRLHSFHIKLLSACTNSEGSLGSGSLIGGSLKLQREYVVANHPSSLQAQDPYQFVFRS